MLNEATLNKVLGEIKKSQNEELSLKLFSVISKNNLLERLLKEEALEELSQLSITRQTVSYE